MHIMFTFDWALISVIGNTCPDMNSGLIIKNTHFSVCKMERKKNVYS